MRQHKPTHHWFSTALIFLITAFVLGLTLPAAAQDSTDEPAIEEEASQPEDVVTAEAPTDVPTEAPTDVPTEVPTEVPTTEAPTEAPTDETPTEAPTDAPTDETPTDV